MGVLCRSVNMESQLVCSPTRIDSFILPSSSKVFWGSALLPFFDFGWVLQLRLNWDRNQLSTWRCQIASKYDHLDRVMLLLAFLDSLGILFMLATIGIVDCMFGRLPVAVPRPVSIFVHRTAILLLSGWNWNGTFFWLLLYGMVCEGRNSI